MNLTAAQKTALATHINANTNVAPIPGSADTFVINTAVAGRDPTLQQGIANWYNGVALVGDNQPFANLFCWNPAMTVQQANSAINWPDSPFGATSQDVTNSWLKWQTMFWSNYVDMTDPQIRQGIIQVWTGTLTPGAGAAGITTPVNIGSVGGTLTGKVAGRRLDLAISPAAIGAVANVWAGAHVVPKDAAGALILASISGQTPVPAQTITATDIDKVLFPNG